LTGDGAAQLVKRLCKLQQLTCLRLNLQGNRVGNERTDAVPWNWLSVFPELEINLQGNGIRSGTSKGKAFLLTSQLAQFQNHKVDMTYNHVGFKGAKKLAEHCRQHGSYDVVLSDNTTTFMEHWHRPRSTSQIFPMPLQHGQHITLIGGCTARAHPEPRPLSASPRRPRPSSARRPGSALRPSSANGLRPRPPSPRTWTSPPSPRRPRPSSARRPSSALRPSSANGPRPKPPSPRTWID
jgi:hypothetical protein